MMKAIAALTLAALAAAPATATLAISHATLIAPDGSQHPDTTVVVAGNRIQAVGQVAIPAGARVIDARGGWLSAGLFDPVSRVGLEELGEDDVTHDALGTSDSRPVQAGLRIADGFYPANTAIPVTRVAGVTTAGLAPHAGLLGGQGAVVDLAGPRPALDGTVVLRSVGQFGSLSPEEAHLPGRAARARVLGTLRELMNVGRGPALPADKLPFAMGVSDYQAVRSLAAGKTRLFLTAHRASDIVAALDFAREQHLPLVLLGVQEGWQVADRIAAAHVPVVVNPFDDLPASLEARGSRLDNAALLYKAGVHVAIGTWSAENARNLRQAAGIAVANGLPWAAGFRAITSEPAALYGLSGRYGAVAPGKVANLVVWGGDPLEPATAVRHVVIGGKEVSLETRQTALARRYRHLPR